MYYALFENFRYKEIPPYLVSSPLPIRIIHCTIGLRDAERGTRIAYYDEGTWHIGGSPYQYTDVTIWYKEVA